MSGEIRDNAKALVQNTSIVSIRGIRVHFHMTSNLRDILISISNTLPSCLDNCFTLSALVNSKRGFLAKARAPRKGRKSQRSELQRVPKSQIARHQDGYRPYFKDWKLDDEIRLLQQL